MRIIDVRAHHVRIPYDAGVASFIQGASAISAIEIVLVEVSTELGAHGLGGCIQLCVSKDDPLCHQ